MSPCHPPARPLPPDADPTGAVRGRGLGGHALRIAAALCLTAGLAGCGLFSGDGGADDRADDPADDGADERADDGADGGAPDAGPTEGPAAGTSSLPSLHEGQITGATFLEAPCDFTEPPGTEPRCGTVAVPLDWENDVGTVTLAVAVFPATTPHPAADPVVYLEGGPGGHALDTLEFSATDLVEPLTERGDVIVFDQRGAGLSEPRLDCDEVTAVQRELEDRPDLPVEEGDDRFHGALRACSERLRSSGIDLARFTSVQSAHDVEAIRVALGYDQWNLLGISYGTRLGLEVLRQHPDGVRSAVLDSVLPPQVDGPRDNPQTFLDSYRAVVDACAAEPACARQGPLDDRLTAVVGALEADPVEIEVTDFLSGETDTVAADGFTLVGVLTQALYSPSWFTDLPELVTELEAGETAALELFLSQLRSTEGFFSDGMFYAVGCNEEVPYSDRDAVAAAVPPDPFGLREDFDFASNVGPSAFETCEAYGGQPAGPIAAEPVESDVPTLLLAGRFDPVTPPAWAEEAAATLSHSTVVIAPHESHGVSPGTCGMSVVRVYLDEPGTTLDTSCFDEQALSFLAVADPAPPELEAFTVNEGAVAYSGVAPADWRDGGSGDFYREASFLDPTQLVYVIGDELLTSGIVRYMADEWDLDLGSSEPWTDGDGVTWQRRADRGDELAVEWYERDAAVGRVVVFLATGPAEIDRLASQVLRPALERVEVGP